MKPQFLYYYKKNKLLFVVFLLAIILVFSFINQSGVIVK